MSATYDKPLPVIDEQSRPWWDAAKRHELLLQSCDSCGRLIFPPAPICPRCWTTQLSWVPASGRGTVWAWTVFHKSYFKGFADEIPYAVAIVELAEGPRMWTQIVNRSPEDVRIGDSVEVVFDDVTADVTLVKFRAIDV